MLAATNNYDYAFEASLSGGVLDSEGRPINTAIEDNYSRDITKCCQKTIKVLTSAVGTLVLLGAYLVAGAWMFQYLEKGNEANACYETYSLYLEKLNTSVIRATGIAGSGLGEEVIAEQLQEAMIDFADALFALDFPPSMNCSLIHTTPFGSKWNWVNAIYFCATIVTTIGYGHVAPATQWGRLVCMFYSILGIPLLLIYLGSIGQLLAYLFRFVYMNICCCRCFRDVRIRRRNKKRMRLLRLEEDLRRHVELQTKLRGEPVPPPKFTPVNMDDDSDADDEIREIYREFQESEDAGIPITIVMLVIAGYIAAGTTLFRLWEDWTIIDGAYFAAITIATIGFGDLVPGNGRFEEASTITELVVGALYCIVGLALLSMCFELMKEELIAKARWIAKHMHMITGRHVDNDSETDDPHESGDHSPEYGGDVGYNECSDPSRHRESTCFSHSFNVSAPQQKKSICVLRSHKGRCSMRKQNDLVRKSTRKAKGAVDTEALGAEKEDGNENEGYEEAHFGGESMDMSVDGEYGEEE